MLQAYIYDGVRTPFGRQGGALAPVRPDDLLAVTIRELAARKPELSAAVEDITIGCANQAGEDSRCVARHAGLAAGLPVSVGGTVVQRNCGSGLGAIASAAHAITSGEGSVMIAGGVDIDRSWRAGFHRPILPSLSPIRERRVYGQGTEGFHS